MAITENTYTGDGATVLFSFTFEYIAESDIKITLDGTPTTAYTLANATTIQFNTAPANGVEIRIYRETNIDTLRAEFFPGSAIRAEDLNNNFTQNLYVTQEVNNNAVQSDDSIPFVNDISMGGYKITNLADPVASGDAATRNFVEDALSSVVPVFYIRWSKTAAGGETSLSGNDDNGISLSYVAGSEKVFINGALQVRGVDYTGTTGTTLTGISALTAGDIVEVHSSSNYTIANLPEGVVSNANVDGSAAIQSTKLAFIQSGTSATTRTVESKLRDVVSVKDFGAVGDGVTDDTAAIQAAIAAAKAVTFPTGSYAISGLSLIDRRSLALIAEGSFDPVAQDVSFVPTTSVTTLFEIGSSGYVIVKGIAFNASSNVTDSIVHIRANSAAARAVASLRIKFEECAFIVGDGSSAQPSVPVRLSNTGQIHFFRCFFEGGSPDQYGISASVAVELGADNPSNPGPGGTPLGNGSINQTTFDECYFKGDVARINASHTVWNNCNFYAKPFNSNKNARLLAPSTSILTAHERIENCYLDTYLTTNYTGTWFTQSNIGGVVVKNCLLAGYDTLLEINAGACEIFSNRFLSLGSATNRSCVKLGANVKVAQIYGNDTSQINTVNNSSNGAKVSVIDDSRAEKVFTNYEELKGTDHTITTTDQPVFTYSYKSLGTYLAVKGHFTLKHKSSSTRTYTFKLAYDNSTVAPKHTVTLTTLDEEYSLEIDYIVYLPPKTEAKNLIIQASTTGDTGIILQDDSWWSIKEYYS